MRMTKVFLVVFLCIFSTIQSLPSSAEHVRVLDRKIPYPYLVVGTISAIPSVRQTQALFLEEHNRGWWTSLSADPVEFVHKIQPIVLSLPSGKSVMMYMTAEEYRASPLHVGDFGRFAPHRAGHERARPNDPYWVAVGCVIVLCSAGDMRCRSDYIPGIYRVADGVELSESTFQPLIHGIRIDTVTMRPKSSIKSPLSPPTHE